MLDDDNDDDYDDDQPRSELNALFKNVHNTKIKKNPVKRRVGLSCGLRNTGWSELTCEPFVVYQFGNSKTKILNCVT